MIAIILCGGFGTRMYPLTESIPKSLLLVANKTVIDYLVDQLDGLEELDAIHIVSNGRFWPQFDKWLQARKQNSRGFKVPIYLHNNKITINEDRLGGIGDLAFVLNRVELPEGALVAAGDNILRFSLKPIWKRFRQSPQNTVLALLEKNKDKLRRTGVLDLDENNMVVGFDEKPKSPRTNWFCPPFYFLMRDMLKEAVNMAAGSNPPDGVGYLIQNAIGKVPIYAEKNVGTRLDIGSMDTYLEANRILSQERVFNES